MLSGGAIDPHYNITAAPSPDTAGTAIVTANAPGTYPFGRWWDADNTSSLWLSPHANEDGSTSGGKKEPVGGYTYETTFDMTGLNLSSAQISGQIEADNTLTQVLLNGSPAAYSSSGGNDYTGFRPISITSGFLSGTNTLDFIVYNSSTTSNQNAAGFRAQLSGTAFPIVSTTTVLTTNLTPSVFSQAVTLTATVRSSTPYGGTPPGSLSFKDGDSTLQTVPLDSTGAATITTTSLTVGEHNLTAVYNPASGPVVYTSSSASVTQNVLNQVISVDHATQVLAEGGQGQVTLMRSGTNLTQPLTVNLSFGPDSYGDPLATAGADYLVSAPGGLSLYGGPVTFEASQSSITLSIATYQRVLSDTSPLRQGFRISISTSTSGSIIGPSGTADVQIDAPSPPAQTIRCYQPGRRRRDQQSELGDCSHR